MREWTSDVDGHAFELPLWRPDRSFSAQDTLQGIEACLSGIWAPGDLGGNHSPSLVGEIDKCLANDVEDAYFADVRPNRGVPQGVPPPPPLGSNNYRVRYQIEVEQHWTLVSEAERRSERIFFPGETLRRGISQGLRELGGEDFPEGMLRQEGKSFVVVIPRKELGEGENSPFWIRLRRRDLHELDTILIAPGDTIYVTRREPKLPN